MKIMNEIILILLLVSIYREDHCLKRLMFDYGLEGYTIPRPELNPFCQTIKNNCCKKDDLLKIFDLYNSQTLPNLIAF